MQDRETRARAYAALGEVSRLAIVEALAHGDLSSSELSVRLDMPSNLLAHHLAVLAAAGLVARHRSEGDGRRTYVLRTPACNRLLGAGSRLPRPRGVAFICSQNSARSQLAEHYWRTISNISATSAGTHPAPRVHPDAITVARRHGLDLTHATPKLTGDILTGDELLIAVCDRAYEELDTQPLHWSVPDPARAGSPGAFETAYDELTRRVDLLAASIEGDRP